MPFGLANAPASFQAMMHLEELVLFGKVLVYALSRHQNLDGLFYLSRHASPFAAKIQSFPSPLKMLPPVNDFTPSQEKYYL
jgi:hypothetical protein